MTVKIYKSSSENTLAQRQRERYLQVSKSVSQYSVNMHILIWEIDNYIQMLSAQQEAKLYKSKIDN